MEEVRVLRMMRVGANAIGEPILSTHILSMKIKLVAPRTAWYSPYTVCGLNVIFFEKKQNCRFKRLTI